MNKIPTFIHLYINYTHLSAFPSDLEVAKKKKTLIHLSDFSGLKL